MAFGALWAIIWICFALFEQPSLEMAYAVSWLGEPPIKVDGCDWGDATRYVGVKVGNGEEVGITLCFKGQTTSTGHHLIRYPGRTLASAQEVIDLSNGYKEKIGTAEFSLGVRKFMEARNDIGRPDSAVTMQGIELIVGWWNEVYAAYLNAEKKGDAARAKQLAERLVALTGVRFTRIDHHSVEFDRYADGVEIEFALAPGDLNDAQQRLSNARAQLWKNAALYLAGGLAVGWALVACVGWTARRALKIPMGQDSARRQHRRRTYTG